MNLFINSLSSTGMLVLFDENRKIIDQRKIEVLMNESSKLLGVIDSFLGDNKLMYTDLNNIVVANGPGSFTGIRTISLIVNTMSFAVKDVYITPISFFDLLDSYPLIKSSSKRDLFVKKDKSDKINIVNNDDFLEYIAQNDIQKVYGDVLTDFLGDTQICFEVDYKTIIEDIEFASEKEIQPLYIKKPNIT